MPSAEPTQMNTTMMMVAVDMPLFYSTGVGAARVVGALRFSAQRRAHATPPD
jgi:hypothetical protein